MKPTSAIATLLLLTSPAPGLPADITFRDDLEDEADGEDVPTAQIGVWGDFTGSQNGIVREINTAGIPPPPGGGTKVLQVRREGGGNTWARTSPPAGAGGFVHSEWDMYIVGDPNAYVIFGMLANTNHLIAGRNDAGWYPEIQLRADNTIMFDTYTDPPGTWVGQDLMARPSYDAWHRYTLEYRIGDVSSMFISVDGGAAVNVPAPWGWDSYGEAPGVPPGARGSVNENWGIAFYPNHAEALFYVDNVLITHTPPEPVRIQDFQVRPARMLSFETMLGSSYELEWSPRSTPAAWAWTGWKIRAPGGPVWAFDPADPAASSTQNAYRAVQTGFWIPPVAEDLGFRYLAADPSLRAALDQTQVILGRATYVGKVLERDQPWESSFVMPIYPGSVVSDPDTGGLRMYYEVYLGAETDRTVAMAVSDDGIHWTKPALNITGQRYSTSPLNNFIDHQDAVFINGPCVFVDLNPGIPPEERYKLSYRIPALGNMLAGVSADGLHFHDVGLVDADSPGLDSLNITFWDPRTEQYQAHMRWKYGAPGVGRGVYAKRADVWAGTWPGPREFTINPHTHPQSIPQLYTPGVLPYHGQYIGLPAAFYQETNGSLYPVFMYSRDSKNWHFEGPYDPVIDLAAHGQDINTFGVAYPATSLVERDGELWIYYSYHPGKHDAPAGDPALWGMHLQRIRVDGFVAIRSIPGQVGAWTTPAIRLPSLPVRLLINAEVQGTVRTEVLHPITLEPYPAMGAADAIPVPAGDHLAAPVSWIGAIDLSALTGQPVALRFLLDDASIYSFRFQSADLPSSPVVPNER